MEFIRRTDPVSATGQPSLLVRELSCIVLFRWPQDLGKTSLDGTNVIGGSLFSVGLESSGNFRSLRPISSEASSVPLALRAR